MRRTLDIFIFFYKLLLKAELCVLGILLLLFSITSIFNNPVVVKDVSAQQVQKVTTQCLKCADLAIIQAGGQSQQEIASDALIGDSTNNIFTTCDDNSTAKAEFNAIIDETTLSEGPNGQKTTVKNAFAECLTNAPDSAVAQIESLQDTSITTSERGEPENPTMNALLEDHHFKSLLEDPDLNALLANPDLNALLEDPNVKALLEDPDVKALLQNPTMGPPGGVFP